MLLAYYAPYKETPGGGMFFNKKQKKKMVFFCTYKDGKYAFRNSAEVEIKYVTLLYLMELCVFFFVEYMLSISRTYYLFSFLKQIHVHISNNNHNNDNNDDMLIFSSIFS